MEIGMMASGAGGGGGMAASSGAALGATDYANIGAGAGSILGPVLTGFQEHSWAQAANQHAMAFARWMDNTKYQRTVRDLSRAGLNPMLAYTQGAHTSGAPAMQIGRAREPDFGGVLAAAKAVSFQKENLRILRAQAMEAEQRAVQSGYDTNIKAATTPELIQQARYETNRAYHGVFSEGMRGSALEAEASHRIMQRALTEEQIKVVQGDAVLRRLNADQIVAELELYRARLPSGKQQAEFDASLYGRILYGIKQTMSSVGAPLMGAAGYITGRGAMRGATGSFDAESDAYKPSDRGVKNPYPSAR